MEWPWRRFEAFWRRHLARKGVREMTNQRDLMIAAVASNPNWDEKDNADARQKRIEGINESFARGVEVAYNGVDPSAEVEEDPMEHPMFNVFRSMGAGVHSTAQPPQLPETGMGAAVMGSR